MVRARATVKVRVRSQRRAIPLEPLRIAQGCGVSRVAIEHRVAHVPATVRVGGCNRRQLGALRRAAYVRGSRTVYAPEAASLNGVDAVVLLP